MNWPAAKLEGLCHFIKNGKSIQQSKEISGLPITRIETIANQSIDTSRVGYAGVSVESAGDFLLEAGDILFSHINSLEHLGKAAIYTGYPEKLVHGMNLLNLRPDQSKVDCRYLLRALRAPGTKAKLLRIANKSVNQASIAAGNLKKIEIPLPPLPEQRRIAAILDKADALRAKRREAIAKLDQLLQSVFLEMFGDPVTNPKGWPMEPLGELVDFSTGKLDSNAAEDDGAYPFFTCSRTPSRIGSYAFDCEALLLAGNNAAGQYWIKHYVGKFNAYQRTYVLRMKSESCGYIYMKQVIQSRLLDLQRMSKGSSTKYLTLGILKPILIPVPPLEDQHKYAAFCTSLEKLRLFLDQASDGLEALFLTAQKRAFSGML